MYTDIGIIDNRNVRFIDKFRAFCKYTKELNIASGYFYVSGFNYVNDNMKTIVEIRIIMGNETDPETAEQIEHGYIERIKDVLIDDLEFVCGFSFCSLFTKLIIRIQ